MDKVKYVTQEYVRSSEQVLDAEWLYYCYQIMVMYNWVSQMGGSWELDDKSIKLHMNRELWERQEAVGATESRGGKRGRSAITGKFVGSATPDMPPESLTSGPCGDPECHVLHDDSMNPIHPPWYVDSRAAQDAPLTEDQEKK